MASVLIVDDQEIVRQTLRLALEEQGLEVRVAGDGEQALRLYREAPADVVVTDLVMPNKEGIETIVELRQSAPAVKIIAMSGTGGTDFLEMALKLGADHVLRKPFTMRKLVALVWTCLGAGQSLEASAPPAPAGLACRPD